MALNLDTRQRAMLEAMGIRVWQPTTQPVPHGMSVEAAAPAAAPAQAAAPVSQLEPPVAPLARVQQADTARPDTPEFIAAPAQAKGSSTPNDRQPVVDVVQPLPAGSLASWTLGPAARVYPEQEAVSAATAQTSGTWLLLLEPPPNPLPVSAAQQPPPGSAQTGLQGDAARLLDNMLRALNLQNHPRIYSAALRRQAAEATNQEAAASAPVTYGSASLAAQIDALVQQLQPSCILVLGLASARAVLGRQEALGRLRSQAHQLSGVPLVVTYDPNFLLRAPQAKAGAWADLCRAQGFVTKHYIPPHSASQ